MTSLGQAALAYAELGWLIYPDHWIVPASSATRERFARGLEAGAVPDGVTECPEFVCSCGQIVQRSDQTWRWCDSPGKHPFAKLAPHGPKDATSDRRKLLRWWQEFPKAHVGIATGRASGVWVLDVDAKSGGLESLAHLIREHVGVEADTLEDLARALGTASARTGGGGLHFFYRYQEELKGKMGSNVLSQWGLPGIDLRESGGHVVAAPSGHASGGRYEWIVPPWGAPRWSAFAFSHMESARAEARAGGEGPVLLTPPWLLERIADPRFNRKQRGSQASISAGEGYALPEVIGEGGRDNELTRFAGFLRTQGLDADAILAQLETVNSERVRPPLDGASLRRIARSIGRKLPGLSPAYAAKKIERPPPIEDSEVVPEAERTRRKAAAGPEPAGVWSAPKPRRAPPRKEGGPPRGDGPVEVLEDREPREFPLTDVGNAERMIWLFGRDLRWAPEAGAWMVFEGHRWVQDRTGGAGIQERAIRTVRSMQKNAFENYDPSSGEEERTAGPAGLRLTHAERKKMYKWGLDSESSSRIAAMIGLARGLPGVPALAEEFDADDMVAGVPNGVVDLRTGELRPGRRGDMISLQLGCPYDPEAACPEFDEFFEWAMDGDEDLAAFLDRFMGYTLTGSVCEEKFLFAHGSGANGKGTLFKLIEAVMGDYVKTLGEKTVMVQKTDQIPQDVAQLKGKRLAIIHETLEGAQFNEGLLKTLAGGDSITARLLHQNEFTFRPKFKLWIAGNHKPNIRSYDAGMERRLMLAPFRAHKLEADRDTGLKDRLLATELPGLLARMVRACVKWEANGLVIPASVRLAGEDYKEESDAVRRFLDERCERDPFDDKCVTGAKDLYSAYIKWAKTTGDYGGKEIWFKRMMQGHRLEQVRRASGKVWLGVRLIEDQEAMQA